MKPAKRSIPAQATLPGSPATSEVRPTARLQASQEALLYFLACRSCEGVCERDGGQAGIEIEFRAREVGLSQSGVVLLAFGSTSVFALGKFAWWMKRVISLA